MPATVLGERWALASRRQRFSRWVCLGLSVREEHMFYENSNVALELGRYITKSERIIIVS